MRLILLAGLTALACARPDAEADPVAQPEPEADADAAADAEAEAEAKAEADAQNWMGQNIQMGMPSMGQQSFGPAAYPDPSGNIVNSGLMPSWPGQGGGSDSCSATDQCCNMRDENCCWNNRRCNVVYKRKCPDRVVEPSCRRGQASKRVSYIIKTCRPVQQPAFVSVPDLACKKTTDTQVITYDVTTCPREPKDAFAEVNITNQDVQRQKDGEICFWTKKCRMSEDQVKKTRWNPEKRCDKIPYQRKECKTVYNPAPPLIKTKVIYDPVSKTVCKKVPKTVCSPSGCGEQGCTNPSYPNVCSSTNFQTENVCGTCQGPLIGDQCQNNCVQVQTPQCGTGSCQRGPQICCRTVWKQVCNQVIVKVARTVQIPIPQPSIPKQECRYVTDYRDECKMRNVPTYYNVTVKKCNPEPHKHCVPVPKYEVIELDKTLNITARGYTCNNQTKTVNKTVEYPTGEICMEIKRPVRKMVTKTVCDQQYTKHKIVYYPVEHCVQGQTPACTNEPEVVCQDSCSQSQQCNYCSEQYSAGSLGQCPTSTCPNFMGGSRPISA